MGDAHSVYGIWIVSHPNMERAGIWQQGDPLSRQDGKLTASCSTVTVRTPLPIQLPRGRSAYGQEAREFGYLCMPGAKLGRCRREFIGVVMHRQPAPATPPVPGRKRSADPRYTEAAGAVA